jgi:hypothetical protein
MRKILAISLTIVLGLAIVTPLLAEGGETPPQP